MKKAMNVIFTLFLSYIALVCYNHLMMNISFFYVLGTFTTSAKTTMFWATVVSPITAFILAIMTGYFYYFFLKKGFKKARVILVVLHLLFLIYTVYDIVNLQNQGYYRTNE